MNSPAARRLFRRYASPASFGIGLAFGLAEMFLNAMGWDFAGRLMIALLFVSAGPMGIFYFRQVMTSRETPYVTEMFRIKNFGWFGFGVVYLIRAFGDFPAPDLSIGALIIYVIVGFIAGIVWTMNLFLLIGLRARVASWDVVSFPAWVGDFVSWALRRSSGEGFKEE